MLNQLLFYRWKQEIFCVICMKWMPHIFGTIYVYVKKVPWKNRAPFMQKCFRKNVTTVLASFLAVQLGICFSVLLPYVLDDRLSGTSRTLEDKDNNFRRNTKILLLIGTAAYPRDKKSSYFYLYVNILMSDFFLP